MRPRCQSTPLCPRLCAGACPGVSDNGPAHYQNINKSFLPRTTPSGAAMPALLTKLAYYMWHAACGMGQDIEVSLEQKAWPNDLCNSKPAAPSLYLYTTLPFPTVAYLH